MIKRLIPETSVYIGDYNTEAEAAATKTIIETDILPWIESFNNISFIESENNYFYYNIGSDTVIMFLYWRNDGAAFHGCLRIGLCRKDSKNIIIKYDIKSSHLIALSNNNNKYIVPNFELHALADKENNLTVLYISGDFTLPASNCPYLFFDIDETGKKYIGFKEEGASNREIFYLDNKRVIQHFYSTGKINNNKALSYFNENYIIMEKVQIFNSLSSQFTSLSTNMVRIINQALNTDKQTNFTVIEVDGDKYRKLEYDIWIKDND